MSAVMGPGHRTAFDGVVSGPKLVEVRWARAEINYSLNVLIRKRWATTVAVGPHFQQETFA
jgi:hypothetical protein